MKQIVIAFFALLLFACTAKKIDGTSKEAFTSSLQEMKNSLSEDKKAELVNALVLLTSKEFMSTGMQFNEKKLYKNLDGMTADEIIAMSKNSK